MRLSQAIEKAQGIQFFWDDPNTRAIRQAITLLIKAADRIQHARNHHTLANTGLLPGETEK